VAVDASAELAALVTLVAVALVTLVALAALCDWRPAAMPNEISVWLSDCDVRAASSPPVAELVEYIPLDSPFPPPVSSPGGKRLLRSDRRAAAAEEEREAAAEDT